MTRHDPIRFGFIGFGRIAKNYHYLSLKKNPRARVAAISDLRPAVLAAGRRLGIPAVYGDYREMLEKENLDAVLITTPPWHHREATEAAARRGLAVFCEKPMAPTLEECDAMLAACEQAQVPLYLGFIRRFDPGFERLRRAVLSGELGRVFHLEAVFQYFVPDYFSPPYSTILKWAQRRFGLDLNEMIGTWRLTDPRTGGGIFQDHAPHYVDLFRWMLDDEVESIAGYVTKVVPTRAFEDQGSCLLRFQKGATAYLQISLATWPGRAFQEYGVVHGSRASMSFRMSSWWFTLPYFLHPLHRNRLRKFSIYNYPFNWWRPVFTGVWRRRWMGDRQMDALVEALSGKKLRGGSNQLAVGLDGRRAMEVVLGTYAFSRQAGGESLSTVFSRSGR